MFKWGIISAASIADSFMQGIAGSEDSICCAIASRDKEKALAFAGKHSIPKAYGSYGELLDDREIDAVYICNLHPWHKEAVLAAAEKGKHVLVEKPAAMTREEAEEMIACCRRHGVFFMEAFMYRCHPQTAAACSIIASGDLGKVGFIQTSFGFRCPGGPEHRVMNKAVGGGAILDVGCYNASLARLLAGAALQKPYAEPESLRATGYLGATGADYITSAALTFEQHIQAVMSVSIETPLPNNAIVCGTRGQMLIENPWGCRGSIRVTGDRPCELSFDTDGKNLYSYEIDCVARGKAPYPAMSPGDTLGNMALLDRWRREIGLEY